MTSKQPDKPRKAPPKEVIGKNGNTLYPFQPGQVANPNGRGKNSKNLIDVLRQIGEGKIDIKDATGKMRNVTRNEAMLLKLYHNAMQGKERSTEIILDRIEGKVVQTYKDETPADANADSAILAKYDITVRKKLPKVVEVNDGE